jgi:hypothetical protein
LLLERLYVNFIKVNLVAGLGVLIGTEIISYNSMSSKYWTHYETLLSGGKGRGFWKISVYSGLSHLPSPALTWKASSTAKPAERYLFMMLTM